MLIVHGMMILFMATYATISGVFHKTPNPVSWTEYAKYNYLTVSGHSSKPSSQLVGYFAYRMTDSRKLQFCTASDYDGFSCDINGTAILVSDNDRYKSYLYNDGFSNGCIATITLTPTGVTLEDSSLNDECGIEHCGGLRTINSNFDGLNSVRSIEPNGCKSR